jgi:hypothetical protein
MKKLLLLIPLTFLSVPVQPVQAQQVTVYQSCVGEVYFPGYYDRYGNFVQGGVSTTRVPCGGYVAQQPVCNPERAGLGALLGGSIAGAISGKGYEYGGSYYNNYGRGSNSGGWSRYDKPNYWVGMGSALGGLAYSC